MGAHAHIEIGRVVIDTAAWLEQRTAGPVADLTQDLLTWATRTRQTEPQPGRWPWIDVVSAWRTARGFVSPDLTDPDDRAVIRLAGTRLDADLWIARMLTPGHGKVAVVLRDDDPPTVLTDTAETADWYDADTVDIFCPARHGWTWRSGRELIDAAGRPTTLTVVFGANLDAPFTPCPGCLDHQGGRREQPCGCDGTSWIVCPICGRRCDVDLTPL